MKISLDALSKNVVGIELDCYLDRQPLQEIEEIVYEYCKKQFQQLVYVALSRVIFNTLFDIIRVCRERYIL